MSHRYRLRQMVRLVRPVVTGNRVATNGLFEITRLMPEDQSGEPSYRIKSNDAGERAVRESEIAARASEA
jgi:hypothetical protein